MVDAGKIQVLFNSTVKQILAGSVDIAVNNAVAELPNDSVIISAGGILPTAFLQEIGIVVESKFGSE